MLAHPQVSATFLRHSQSARSRHGSCAPWIAWDCDLAARRFHPKLVSRETYRSKIRPCAHPWKLAHQRVAPRGRRAQGPLYLERFRLAASLMVLARSSEPRSPVVQFHVKRLGGNAGSRVACRGSEHPLPPLTVLLDVVADVTGGSTVTRRALHPTTDSIRPVS